MSRSRMVVAAGSAAVALGAVSAAAGATLRNPHRRTRLERSARVWWLTARRSAAWAVTKARGVGADDARRAELEHRFAIRSAEDVAAELGNMKGAMMKLGQLVSFIAEGLPPEAQQALASLQADVAPMAPSLAEAVVRDELGDEPRRLFLDWDPVPVAAASVGQVHRAVLPDGRRVAVKVQYPGVDRAIRSDLDNAELLYGLVSAISLKGLDVKGLVDELRARMGDELDYRLEGRHQAEFATIYRGHPFLRVPDVVPQFSAQRVLTTDWADGLTWAEFEATASPAGRQRAAEVLFRFAQGSIHRYGVFNGDPHPGNYRFHVDGTVTFLDFGLVKRWSPGEWERLSPCMDAILDADAPRLVEAMVLSDFLPAGHGLDPSRVFDYVSAPYVPYLTERFTFSRTFTATALSRVADLGGPSADVIRLLNLPPSFVILDRVVWGITALLGKLEASGPWRAILDEYRHGGPPATELGRQDAEWRAASTRGSTS